MRSIYERNTRVILIVYAVVFSSGVGVAVCSDTAMLRVVTATRQIPDRLDFNFRPDSFLSGRVLMGAAF